MAAENIGTLVPTKIPGYSDSADIQAALRVYHYGSYSYDPANTSAASLVNPSIAYTLNDMQDQIDAIGTGGILPSILTAKGSLISASASSTPLELAVGASNGMVLTVNSATATGLQWSVPEVTLTNSATLSNKTLTSPTLNDALANNIIVKGPEERLSVSATAATGTVNLDVLTSGILYYTSNATGNWTLNVRGSASTSLNNVMTTNDSITVVFFVTNGATAYYESAFQIDGVSVTPKWQNAVAPSSGNTNSIDIYSHTIIKTGNAAFTVFSVQTRFA